MKITIDLKTLIIGLILGVILAFALGIDGAGEADFGISVPTDGNALVQTEDGGFYVINPRNAMAARVLEFRNISNKPDDSRTTRGRLFNINNPSGPVQD